LVGIEPVVRTNSNGYEYTQETSSLMWGRSTSPLIYNDMVVVPAGGPVGGTAVTMIAFDVEDGQERWRGGERNASYGSPSLITVAGQVQIALVVENAAVGHDPDTGQQLWSHPWVGNSDSNASCSQVTPLANEDGAGGMVLLSKGYGIGGEVVRLKRDENGWTAEQQQRNPRVLKTKFTNPVIVNGHAYSLSSGFLECTEVPSLQRRWKKRGRFGNGQLLLVGDKLLVHSESGTLTLVQVNPEKYQPLGRCKTIEGVCWNTLCLSGDRLLVRSEREAAMIRLPLESRPSQNVDTLSLP
jgi:outer membrane protein assembly factor BamB